MFDLELHAHTRFSPDSLVGIESLIARCREIGLARVAITDHDAAEGALRAHALAPDLVIAGEEVMTTEGELLCYFIRERITPRQTPEETCDAVHAQGGIVGPSHPCDTRRRGLGAAAVRRLAGKLDFIEVFNSRTRNPAQNDEAAALALELDLPGIAGSDAHSLGELGTARTRVAGEPSSPQAFLNVLRTATLAKNISPARVMLHSRRAALVHAIGLGRK